MMNAKAFGYAWAASAAILWIICSLAVILMPSAMMEVTGHMVHSNLSSQGWVMTPTGFVIGLAAWSLSSGAFGWLAASLYNRYS